MQLSSHTVAHCLSRGRRARVCVRVSVGVRVSARIAAAAAARRSETEMRVEMQCSASHRHRGLASRRASARRVMLMSSDNERIEHCPRAGVALLLAASHLRPRLRPRLRLQSTDWLQCTVRCSCDALGSVCDAMHE